MQTNNIASSLTTLFSELVDGAKAPVGGNFVLNSGDPGLLASLDKLSAADASRSVHGGATFAGAKWDEAWKTSAVNDAQWAEIRAGLADETRRWLQVLGSPRDVSPGELSAIIGESVHVAYHFGAIRQIATNARGPR